MNFYEGKKARNKHVLFMFGLGFCLFLAPPPCSFSEQNRKHVVAENGETEYEQFTLPSETDFTFILLSIPFNKL